MSLQKMSKFLLQMTFGASLVLLTACQATVAGLLPTATPKPDTTGDANANREHPLIGKVWALAGYTLPDGTSFEPVGHLQIVFNAENMFSITGGCNRISGGWTLGDGQHLTFSPGPSTLMACEETLMRQEADTNQLLAEVNGYLREGTALTLKTAAGGSIQFTEQADANNDAQALTALVGNQWHVVAQLVGGDAVVSFSTTPILQFAADGSLSGQTGCNKFFGTYSTNADGGLTLHVTGTTKMACEEALMQQEQAFLETLTQVVGLEMGEAGMQLVLTGEGRLYLEVEH
jgi:heat shock protein HslJ